MPMWSDLKAQGMVLLGVALPLQESMSHDGWMDGWIMVFIMDLVMVMDGYWVAPWLPGSHESSISCFLLHDL